MLSGKSGIYEKKFVRKSVTFRDAALKLRLLLRGWCWHISIRQSTAHWQKFKIETLDVGTIVIMWDYANRNDMVGAEEGNVRTRPKARLFGCARALQPDRAHES